MQLSAVVTVKSSAASAFLGSHSVDRIGDAFGERQFDSSTDLARLVLSRIEQPHSKLGEQPAIEYAPDNYGGPIWIGIKDDLRPGRWTSSIECDFKIPIDPFCVGASLIGYSKALGGQLTCQLSLGGLVGGIPLVFNDFVGFEYIASPRRRSEAIPYDRFVTQ